MTPEDLTEIRAIVAESETRLDERLTEKMRDMQTEIIRALERFARGNFARMHRLEVSDDDLNQRINALEERVLALEVRPPQR
jgi:hypothetical protein